MKKLRRQYGCCEPKKTGTFWHNLCEENYKTSNIHLNNQKNTPYILLGRINIMKHSDLPKLIYKPNATQIKIIMGGLGELKKNEPICKKTKIINKILGKN